MSRSLSRMQTRCDQKQINKNRLTKWLRSPKLCGKSCMLNRSCRVSFLVRLTFFRASRQNDSFAQERLETSSSVTKTCQTWHLCLADVVSTKLATKRIARREEARGTRGEEAAGLICYVWQQWTVIIHVTSRVQLWTTEHHQQRRGRASKSVPPQFLRRQLYFVCRIKGKMKRKTKSCILQ